MLDDDLRAQYIAQARRGDWEAAEALIEEFLSLEPDGAPKDLVGYIAECLSVWKQAGFSKDSSQESFHVRRPAHRLRELQLAQTSALHAYYRARLDGEDHTAAVISAANELRLQRPNSPPTTNRETKVDPLDIARADVRRLLKPAKDTGPTDEQAAALLLLKPDERQRLRIILGSDYPTPQQPEYPRNRGANKSR